MRRGFGKKFLLTESFVNREKVFLSREVYSGKSLDWQRGEGFSSVELDGGVDEVGSGSTVPLAGGNDGDHFLMIAEMSAREVAGETP